MRQVHQGYRVATRSQRVDEYLRYWLEGDAEPAPQFRRMPLPHDVAGVVVAVRAQRHAQL